MDKDEVKKWCVSLGYALRTGLKHLYMLDGPEIEFEYEPAWEERDATSTRKVGVLTFVDAAVGGSGFLDRAAAELHPVAQKAIDHLDHENCETACYRWLKSYPNQRYHAFLNWPRIIGDLHESAAPEPRPAEKADDGAPGPWLEAYAAGVGSPLELRFLRLFEAKEIAVEKQVGVPPEAPLSTADFAQVDRKVAIYVNGAAFHVGDRLRRDRAIRSRLRELGWRVVEYGVRDLTASGPVLDVLRS
ncbi:Zn-binding domain-containing protein [Anaeromyxobacter sp. Red801]|uniref:Zn-binding domain-containing protein n=1 Tax=Anaeromyxobacter sp. Red801 TaxID=3411632 RepID=UPI003B9FC51C